MNNTLEYLKNKFGLDTSASNPVAIRNVNRTIMAKTLGELGFKVGAEVGVAEGLHAKVLLDNIPNLKLHLVDAWMHYPGYQEYNDLTDCMSQAFKRLEGLNIEVHRNFSSIAVNDFADNSLDFVYIDAGHDFKNVAVDICDWTPKVKVGGIVFGHDFKRSKRNVVDVKDVVPAYCYAKGISPWFELKNDIKDPTFGRDNAGWLFVRQERDRI